MSPISPNNFFHDICSADDLCPKLCKCVLYITKISIFNKFSLFRSWSILYIVIQTRWGDFKKELSIYIVKKQCHIIFFLKNRTANIFFYKNAFSAHATPLAVANILKSLFIVFIITHCNVCIFVKYTTVSMQRPFKNINQFNIKKYALVKEYARVNGYYFSEHLW